jgi:hypothetical protein
MLLVIIKCMTDYIEVTYPQIRSANGKLDDPSSRTFAADLNDSIASRLRIMHKSLSTNSPAPRTTVSRSQVVIEDEERTERCFSRSRGREDRLSALCLQLG